MELAERGKAEVEEVLEKAQTDLGETRRVLVGVRADRERLKTQVAELTT